jgi:hypothetical protein
LLALNERCLARSTPSGDLPDNPSCLNNSNGTSPYRLAAISIRSYFLQQPDQIDVWPVVVKYEFACTDKEIAECEANVPTSCYAIARVEQQ